MSGQSITDRIVAAQYSLTGSAISKAISKATTHEVSGPKKKHLDYLIHCTNEMNVNVPQLADTLFERTASSSWVVVFKALITTHHLMMYGNERFIQYLASRNTLFNLNNFLDKGALQGYDMSTFIRRYSRYLNEKALSYRLVAVDFTKMKRGIDGVMRTMNTEKLIKTLPIIQNQLDALLDFQANPNELTNGVINAAFMLLFKDSIRLFAAYNEGVINLLGKPPCSLMPEVHLSLILKNVFWAPSSLLEALEQHLASLEGKKTKEFSADSRATTLSSAVSSLSNTGMSFTRVDEKEKQQALEEEQARLQALKDQRLKEISMQTPSASPGTQSANIANNHSVAMDPFSNHTITAPVTNSMPNLTSDLFDLQPAFIPAVQSTPSISTATSAWGGRPRLLVSCLCQGPNVTGPSLITDFFYSGPPQQATHISTMNVDFDAVFGAQSANNDVKPAAGFDTLGDLLKPTIPAHSQGPVMPPHTGGKLLASDLDSSLANLVGNLQFGSAGKKPDMHWTQPGEKKLTGGSNWQSKTMSSTTAWSPAPMPPQAPAPMAFPMTTPQVPVYGMVSTISLMTPQPMMYNQPVLRPTNPFAPIPGAQVQIHTPHYCHCLTKPITKYLKNAVFMERGRNRNFQWDSG
uniref:Si:ch211-200p22.4 n=1 Tax=Astyanax mexicanus TaxID=7994 RepID=A0A8B9LEL3_ASTMX